MYHRFYLFKLFPQIHAWNCWTFCWTQGFTTIPWFSTYGAPASLGFHIIPASARINGILAESPGWIIWKERIIGVFIHHLGWRISYKNDAISLSYTSGRLEKILLISLDHCSLQSWGMARCNQSNSGESQSLVVPQWFSAMQRGSLEKLWFSWPTLTPFPQVEGQNASWLKATSRACHHWEKMPGQDQHWPGQHFRVALMFEEHFVRSAMEKHLHFKHVQVRSADWILNCTTASPPIRLKCARGHGPQSHPTCPWGHWPQEGRGPHYSLSCFDFKSRGSNYSNHTTHLNAPNHRSSTCVCQAYIHTPYITLSIYIYAC